MKVGIIVRHFWHRKLSSLPRAVYEISKHLIKNNCDVTIFTNSEADYNGEVILDDNLRVKYVNNIIEAVNEECFDIIHFYGSILGAYLLVDRIVTTKKIILSLYTSKYSIKDITSFKLKDFISDRRCGVLFNFSIANIIPNRVFSNKFKKVNRVIVISHRLKKFYSSILKEKKVLRIPHGVDFKKFSRTKKRNVHKLRRELGYLESDKIILYLGHAYLIRGIDDLITAMRELSSENPDAKLMLLLNKMPGSPMKRINKLILENLDKKSVKVIIKYVDNPEYYYNIADIIVLPYRVSLEIPEYPFVLLEAMAAGRPILTTDIGAIPELIKDGYNGLLVSPKKPELIVSAITKLLNNPELASKLGKNAKKTAIEFDWNRVSRKLLTMYGEVLNEK